MEKERFKNRFDLLRPNEMFEAIAVTDGLGGHGRLELISVCSCSWLESMHNVYAGLEYVSLVVQHAHLGRVRDE